MSTFVSLDKSIKCDFPGFQNIGTLIFNKSNFEFINF